jgi:O-antigen/teichoic acid export membrane protein
LLGQTAVYGTSTIIGRLLNYLLVPLYTYQFTNPADYGVNNEFYAYISFLNILFTYGMETALFRFSRTESRPEPVYATAVTALVVSSVLFVAPVFLFPGALSDFLGYPGKSVYVVWVGIILFTDALCAIPFAALRQENRALRFAGLKFGNIIINIGLNLFFIGYCKTLYEKVLAGEETAGFFSGLYNPDIGIGYVFISNGIANLVTLFFLMPKIYASGFRFNPSLFRRMLKYSAPLIVVGLAGMVNETLDRILIKYLSPGDRGLSELGIYGACYKIPVLMTIFIQAFRYAAEPFFFSYTGKKEGPEIFSMVMTFFVIAASVVFLGTLLNLSWIQYFIGSSYREGLHIVPVLLLANWFLGIYYNISIWYKISGKTGYGALITIAGAVLTLIINLSLIPVFGYVAAAWATLVCYAGMMMLVWHLGNKHFPVNYDSKRIWGYLVISVVLYLISLLLPEGPGKTELIFKNLLLLLFLAGVWKFEKTRVFARLKKTLTHDQNKNN